MDILDTSDKRNILMTHLKTLSSGGYYLFWYKSLKGEAHPTLGIGRITVHILHFLLV
jgi:hypothetical protein